MLPKSLNQLLGDPNALPGRLAARAERIGALDHAINAVLDPELASHCRVIDHDEAGTLTIAADSPVWATRLRYHTGTLPETLEAATGLHFSRVVLRVSPPGQARTVPGPKKRAKPSMSAQTAKVLEASAAAQDDPVLSAALERLARHGRDDGQPA